MNKIKLSIPIMKRTRPNYIDILAFILFCTMMALIGSTIKHTLTSIPPATAQVIHLDISYLPGYAYKTTLRMLVALIPATIFTFTYGVLCAKSKRAEVILIPLLDLLQSVPILGFLTFTTAFFLDLFPGRELGVELVAIFSIFTAQAWNMAFSIYQSIKTIPSELEEVTRNFRLTSWQKFWRLEVPFAIPGLIWNTMLSMSAGWFMIVYTEAVQVGDTNIMLPGIGSYVTECLDKKYMVGIVYAVIFMFFMIWVYDTILFRPLVTWSEKFTFENVSRPSSSDPFVFRFFRRSRVMQLVSAGLGNLTTYIGNLPIGFSPALQPNKFLSSKILGLVWRVITVLIACYCCINLYHYFHNRITLSEIEHVAILSLFSLIRVLVMLVLVSLIWLPISVWVGLRPKWSKRIQIIAQFMAAYPSNMLFPFFVIPIAAYNLNPDIWLSILIVLGAQWYILFNVVAGTASYPTDMLEAAKIFNITGWTWWRRVILPGIWPFYVTGVLTSWGGAWNATIMAEIANWGNTTITAHGLGAYISQATTDGNSVKVAFGVAVMSIIVLTFNRCLWRPMYDYASNKLKLG